MFLNSRQLFSKLPTLLFVLYLIPRIACFPADATTRTKHGPNLDVVRYDLSMHTYHCRTFYCLICCFIAGYTFVT